MAVKLRLARWGAKKNPYYHIVVADSRSPRDGKLIETVGKYDPMLTDLDKRCTLKADRVKYWLSVGATPTDKVNKIFAKVGLTEAKPYAAQPKKSTPKAKAQERMKANATAQAESTVKQVDSVADVVEETQVTEEVVVEEVVTEDTSKA